MGGFVSIPNALYLASQHDPVALGVFSRFAGDQYFSGGLLSARRYEAIYAEHAPELGLKRGRLGRMLAIFEAALENHECATHAPQVRHPEEAQPPAPVEDLAAPPEQTRHSCATHAPLMRQPSILTQLNSVRTTENTNFGKVRSVWPQLQSEALRHGKAWRKLSEPRLKLIAARLSEGASEADLVAAIHGALGFWGAGDSDFKPSKYLTPETLYRASNFWRYVEAKPRYPQPSPAKIEGHHARLRREDPSLCRVDELSEADRAEMQRHSEAFREGVKRSLIRRGLVSA
jgi:uncharacterized phage protein (TIGR02220 family)